MVTTSIRAKMFLHGTIGMRHRNLIERRVAGQTRRFEHQFQIHHVVNDNRTFPTPFRLPSAFHIPRLDNPGSRTEAGRQRLGSLHHHIFIRRRPCQSQAIPETAIYNKSDIMMPSQVFGFLYGIRIFGGQRQQRAVARQFIQIPDRSGEKAAPPIRITTIIDRTVCLKRHRIQAFPTRFDHTDLIPYLCTGKIDILVNKTFFLCFRGTCTR